MMLNACVDGKDIRLPAISTLDWYICIYTPASAGPIELPTILSSVFIPSDMPVNSAGVASSVTFRAPTLVSDNPVDSIARPAETAIQLPWNARRKKNPAVVIEVPIIIGLIDPILCTMNPEVGPKTKSTIANGSCTYPAVAASPPNPSGSGFRTSTGTVWNTMNIENPTVMIIRLAGRIALCDISLKSTSGSFSRRSITTKSQSAVAPTATKIAI